MDTKYVFRFLTGKYTGKEFPLNLQKKHYLIGRSMDMDLVLADDAVSRKHARFYQHQGLMWLCDLGSRNGTLVNGKAVDLHCLQPGEYVAIGASLFQLGKASIQQTHPLNKAGEKTRSPHPESIEFANGSMSGSIQDNPLVDVLQWLATSRKTGTLRVKSAEHGHKGKVYLRDGQAFYAIINQREQVDPEKALIRMLGWSKGIFSLENAVVDEVPQRINSSLNHILMEALRLQDELNHLAQKNHVPHYGTQVQLVYKGNRWRDLAPEELDLIQKLAEGKLWSDLLDESYEDEVTLTKRLIDLQKRGYVSYE